MVSRISIFLYSLVCYAVALAALLYAVGFIGDFVVPKTIDSGTAADPLTALFYDLPLLALFALQHSIMARQGFKRAWTKIVPKAAERATYVLLAGAILFLIYWQWRPIAGAVWTVTDPLWAQVLMAAYFVGWGIVFLSTFLINHFELMGLQQSFAGLRGKEVAPPSFKTPLLYKLVRHPIYLGLLIIFWATPHMSMGHLVFALATSGYIFIGILLEERDLIAFFGDTYRNYKAAVPMVIPLAKFGRTKRV